MVGVHTITSGKLQEMMHRKLQVTMKKPFDPALLTTEDIPPMRPRFKPSARGAFWIAIGAGWRKYNRSTNDTPRRAPNTYYVTLPADLRLIFIDSAEDAQEFFRTYGDRRCPFKTTVFWEDVRKECDGIVVNLPYWTETEIIRYPLSDWVYGWDCESMVVWNVQGIQEMRFEPVVYESSSPVR